MAASSLPQTGPVEAVLSQVLPTAYPQLRYSPSPLDRHARQLSSGPPQRVQTRGCDLPVIAGTREAWDPATHGLRDEGKSVAWRLVVDNAALHELYRTQYYLYRPAPPARGLATRAAVALATLARMLSAALPGLAGRSAAEPDCVARAAGVAEVLYRAAATVAPTLNPEGRLAALQFPAARLRMVGGRTLLALVRPFVSAEVLGDERAIAPVPWELVCVHAVYAGVTNLALLRALVFVEFALRAAAPLTQDVLRHHEAFDLVVENADIVFYLLAECSQFLVVQLCTVLEGASLEQMPLVDLLLSTDLGPKTIFDSNAAESKRPSLPEKTLAEHINRGMIFSAASAASFDVAPSRRTDPTGRKNVFSPSEQTHEAPNDTILWIDAKREVEHEEKRYAELRRFPNQPSRSGGAPVHAKRTGRTHEWLSSRSLREELAGVGLSSGHGSSNFGQSAGYSGHFMRKPQTCCNGRLRVGPPVDVVRIDKDVSSNATATVEGQRWVLRVAAGKLDVRVRRGDSTSYVESRLRRRGGVQVVENNQSLCFQEETEWNGALVSETLRGLFGEGAARWLLSHIWRFTVNVSVDSPTKSYLPTSLSRDGYKVTALVPFDVIRETKFFCANDVLYWLPKDGEKLRKVSISRGGTLVFAEAIRQPTHLEACTVESTRRVG